MTLVNLSTVESAGQAHRLADAISELSQRLHTGSLALAEVSSSVNAGARRAIDGAAWTGSGACAADRSFHRNATGIDGLATSVRTFADRLREIGNRARHSAVRISTLTTVENGALMVSPSLIVPPVFGLQASALELTRRGVDEMYGAVARRMFDIDDVDRDVAAAAHRFCAELAGRAVHGPAVGALTLVSPEIGSALIAADVILPPRAAADALAELTQAAQDGDAAMVGELYGSLPPGTAEALTRRYPKVVGALDGVPPAVRYAANKRVLADAITHATGERRAHLQRLARGDRHFLLIDPRGAGKVVEVLGDLSKSRHAAVVVPGINNTLDNYDTNLGAKARAVRSAASAYDPGTAVVAWLGYDTPGDSTAIFPTTANGAGEPLADAVDGLSVTAPQAAVTVVAHSYGTLVAGRALQRGMRPTAVVVAGSPGMGVNRVSSLLGTSTPGPLPPVYALRAPGDPIALSENFGRDPADSRFHATRLQTGLVGGGGPTGHSDYFDPRTESARNIARVVSGQQSSVTVQRAGALQRAGERSSDVMRFLHGDPGPSQQPSPSPWSLKQRLRDPDLPTDLLGDIAEYRREHPETFGPLFTPFG